MKITITIKNELSEKTYDISLDNQQKVATTLQVMRENLPESLQGIGDNPEIQSERTSRHLRVDTTYEESHIYTGDVLIISQGERE